MPHQQSRGSGIDMAYTRKTFMQITNLEYMFAPSQAFAFHKPRLCCIPCLFACVQVVICFVVLFFVKM